MNSQRGGFFLGMIVGAVMALAALAGCEKPADVPVAIGTNIWPGYEPGYIAKDNKLYGVTDVSLRQFPSATEVLRAFRNQSVDVAALTLDEALMLRHYNHVHRQRKPTGRLDRQDRL